MDLSNVHVILIRHAQATSNVHGSDQSNIPGGSSLTELDLRRLAHAAQHPESNKVEIKNGEYLPDGLTQHGIDDANRFKSSVGALDGVCLLASSPLTRAVQTLQLIKEKFGADPTTQIHCHPGLQEATPWPHDFPHVALERHENKLSYIKLQGGGSTPTTNGHGNKVNRPGLILGEETVDITNVQYRSSSTLNPPAPNHPTTKKANPCPSQSQPETLRSILYRTQQARQWIRSQAVQALLQKQQQGHQKNGTTNNHRSCPGISSEAPLRLVICVHGGLWNFLTGRWTCRTDPCTGRFQSSTTVPNLGVGVYRFVEAKEEDDEEARLIELGRNEGGREYERILGEWYVHRGGGAGRGLRTKRNGEGMEKEKVNGDSKAETGMSQEKQMRAHMEFIEKKQGEVKGFGQKEGGEELLETLRGWRGVEAFWKDTGIDMRI